MGGYFELELRTGLNLYPDAVGFNSARSALKALLQATATQRLHLPHHVCRVVGDAALAVGVSLQRHAIDLRLELVEPPTLLPGERLLYVNYFGLKDHYIRDVLAPRYGERLVVDNSQALFSPPLAGIATLYSPRKFVGVPDGGWLANPPPAQWELPPSDSAGRFGALLGRLETCAEDHYSAFLQAEAQLDDAPVAAMSNSTRRLLDSLDYPNIASRRRANLAVLRSALGNGNPLHGLTDTPAAALCYPLLADTPAQAQAIRESLRGERIFIPCYWPEVIQAAQSPALEQRLASCVLALPIDQRYDAQHMHRLAERIQWFMAKR